MNRERPWRDEELLKKMKLDRDMTHDEISNELGCSQPTISKWVSEYGIEKKPCPWNNEEKLRKLYIIEGLSLREIGNHLDCCRSTVANNMDEFGIERRLANDEYGHVPFSCREHGYEYWRTRHKDEIFSVKHHRLLAVVKYGFDAVKNMDVHHVNGIKWDNRVENLELMTHSEHSSLHSNERREEQREIMNKLREEGEMMS